MKIKFVDGDTIVGKVNGIIQMVDGKGSFSSFGSYSFIDKTIEVVKQKYQWLTFLILCHELIHWVIDCIFPNKDITEIHFLHNIFDKYSNMNYFSKED